MSDWKHTMAELEKMGKGRLAVKFAVLDSIGHTNFTVKRTPAGRHKYFVVVENDSKKWCLASFDNGVVEWHGGTIKI